MSAEGEGVLTGVGSGVKEAELEAEGLSARAGVAAAEEGVSGVGVGVGVVEVGVEGEGAEGEEMLGVSEEVVGKGAVGKEEGAPPVSKKASRSSQAEYSKIPELELMSKNHGSGCSCLAPDGSLGISISQRKSTRR